MGDGVALKEGETLPFDARDLLGIQFQAYDWAFPALAPIDFDFCIDDIELLTLEVPDARRPGEGLGRRSPSELRDF